MKLGQPSPTLSGGEAQRIKLARELVKKSTGRTLYLLDEPTTGLHFADIEMLLKVLHGFVEAGNTVLVVEHNMEVIKTADWIIDLGPEGGNEGGLIVAQGTPEQVAKNKKSYTGQVLRHVFEEVRGKGLGARDEERTKRLARELAPGDGVNARGATGSLSASVSASTAGRASQNLIKVRGARQNNLKGVDVDIPRDQLTVFCGPSGSGKSSLAMDTIYAEGQRRYVESLSAYARQFVGQMQKPKLDHIEGLSPAIAIEQKHSGHTPRSTVGTVTEIYDYLRILVSRLGVPHCPACDVPVGTQSAMKSSPRSWIIPPGTKLYIMAPWEVSRGPAIRNRLGRDAIFRIRADSRGWADILPGESARNRPAAQTQCRGADRSLDHPARRQIADRRQHGKRALGRPRRDAR